jgi:hypothetical protein
MLPCVDADPDAVWPRVVDPHRRIRRIVTAVVSLSRVTSLAMVALSVAALVRGNDYTKPPLAVATYALVRLGNLVYLPLVARRDPIPGGFWCPDLAVTAAAVVALPFAIHGAMAVAVAVPDLEPLIVATAVAVALISASLRATAAGCLNAAAYGVHLSRSGGPGADAQAIGGLACPSRDGSPYRSQPRLPCGKPPPTG